MMNLLAIGLLVSTLTAAGVWSPPVSSPHYSHHQSGSGQVLHEKNRIIVVEYEREIPTGTGVTGTEHEKALPESAKDKICDAFGVCRDKLSGAASEIEHTVKSAKDKISDVFHHKVSDSKENVNAFEDKLSEAKEKTKDKLSDMKESAGNKLFQAKDKTEEKLYEVKETAENKLFEAKEAIKDKLSQGKEKTEDKLSRGKEKVEEDKLSRAKEKTEDKLSEAKEKVEDKLSKAHEASKDKLSDLYEETMDKASRLKEEMEETKEKTGEFADKTAKNLSDIIKRARDVAYDMASYVANPKMGRTVWSVLQLLGFALAYGTSVWVTFISSHVLSSALPRQQFGIVQSKVYPVYFRAVAYGIGVAFLTQFFGRDREKLMEKVQGYNLLSALGMVLVNLFFLEPMATKVMFERLKAEKEEGRGRDTSDVTTVRPTVTTTTATTTTDATIGSFSTAKTTKTTTETEMNNEEERIAKNKLVRLSRKLRMWNGYSSGLNVVVLMALTWHLVHLARLMSCCD